jgi:hypothetical protein
MNNREIIAALQAAPTSRARSYVLYELAPEDLKHFASEAGARYGAALRAGHSGEAVERLRTFDRICRDIVDTDKQSGLSPQELDAEPVAQRAERRRERQLLWHRQAAPFHHPRDANGARVPCDECRDFV